VSISESENGVEFMGGVNPIVATVTFIRQVKGGNQIGSATGFFYTRGDNLFLVTNKHVVRDDQTGTIPDLLRLRLHKQGKPLTENEDYDVALYAGGQALWKTPPANVNADVAMVKLNNTEVMKDFFVQAWAKESFLPPSFRLEPGEDVFVMGYPLGFHDQQHNLPVFRNAFIGSVYGIPFQGMPLFLTDANLHPGTSGSPVITKPKSTWVDEHGNTNLLSGTVYYLLGIHSGTVSPNVTGGIVLGMGATWYAQLIEDTAATF
jgi:S1-C subfamily serine protease